MLEGRGQVGASSGAEGLKKTSKYVVRKLYMNYLLFRPAAFEFVESRREVMGVVEMLSRLIMIQTPIKNPSSNPPTHAEGTGTQ